MKAFKITDMKDFMNKLLLSDSFDYFLLEEGLIVTFNTFQIDGHIKEEFYTKEEREEPGLCPYAFSLWKEMRPLCFQLIKGKKTPLHFKFVLLLQPEHMERILSKESYDNSQNLLKSFTLTVKYDGSGATMITGISTSSFLMDKTPEQLWDNAFRKFLYKNHIAWEEV